MLLICWLYLGAYLINQQFQSHTFEARLPVKLLNDFGITRENALALAYKEQTLEQTLSNLNQQKVVPEESTAYLPRTILDLYDQLDLQFNNDFILIRIKAAEKYLARKTLELFLPSYLKEIQSFAKESIQKNSANWKAEDREITEEIKIISKELEQASKQMAVTNNQQLILEYQYLARIYGPRHPRMQEILTQIVIPDSEKKLTHEDIIAYSKAETEPSDVYAQLIKAAKDKLIKLQLHKSTLAKNLQLNKFMPGPEQYETATIALTPGITEQAWFKSAWQSLIALFIGLALYCLHIYLTPTFKEASTLSRDTGLDSSKIISFPNLPTKKQSVAGLLKLSGANYTPLLPDTSESAPDLPVLQYRNSTAPAPAPEKNALESLASDLIFAAKQNRKKIFLFASGKQGDGNTTVVCNLAAAFSRINNKVLLIDANLENPSISQYFNLPDNLMGFSDLLIGHTNQNLHIRNSGFPGLDILPIGQARDEARQILSNSKSFRVIKALTKAYNFILIDSGCLQTASSSFIAGHIGAVYLVVSARSTEKEVVKKALVRLEKIKVKTDGVILNKASA